MLAHCALSKNKKDELQIGPDLTDVYVHRMDEQELPSRGAGLSICTWDRRAAMHGFFKSDICKNFMAGTCRLGYSCRFAHGVHELQKTPEINAPQLAANMVAVTTTGEHFGGSSSASEISTRISECSRAGSHDLADCWGPCPEVSHRKLRYTFFSKSTDEPTFTTVNFA